MSELDKIKEQIRRERTKRELEEEMGKYEREKKSAKKQLFRLKHRRIIAFGQRMKRGFTKGYNKIKESGSKKSDKKPSRFGFKVPDFNKLF